MTERGETGTRKPPPAIPVLVLTGFLGAGKTTLLNRWVQSPALSGAVVIVNEFGEIGIDHLLIERSDDTMFTLPSGCVCCTARGDLIATFEDLIRRRDNGRIAPFDRVVVETTGLADPAPVLNAVVTHPYLSLRYGMDRVVTVVDVVQGLRVLREHEQARIQVAVADTVVVSKTDLADRTALAALMEQIDGLNPRARRLDAAAGEAGIEAILGTSLVDATPADRDLPSLTVSPPPFGGASSGRFHASDIGSFVLTSAAPLDPTAFQMFVDLLRGSFGANLLRVKGLVALANEPDRPFLVQGVQHFFHPPQRLPGWPDRDRRSRLVVIVRDLDRTPVERMWSAFFEGPRADQPDAAALLHATAGEGGLLG